MKLKYIVKNSIPFEGLIATVFVSGLIILNNLSYSYDKHKTDEVNKQVLELMDSNNDRFISEEEKARVYIECGMDFDASKPIPLPRLNMQQGLDYIINHKEFKDILQLDCLRLAVSPLIR
jgi:hypothetical protein